ncbi:hypothetical protein WJX81_008017 [Elliptochloris bilobata]|uniref:Myb-like domain-containing protein n=1 Tax=Elliptochloris bilobata TaxID=381761 RepID=A0AAW1R370_9CHLO
MAEDYSLIFATRHDPVRDGSIFGRRRSSAATPAALATPQATLVRPCAAPAAPLATPAAAGHSPADAATAPSEAHGGGSSARAFRCSEVARQIRANFDSLVRASPLPRAVEQLITPQGTEAAQEDAPDPMPEAVGGGDAAARVKAPEPAPDMAKLEPCDAPMGGGWDDCPGLDAPNEVPSAEAPDGDTGAANDAELGRMRVQPLAYWANQTLMRDPLNGDAFRAPRSAAGNPKPQPRQKLQASYSRCAVCKKAKKGYCGTDRADKRCMNRQGSNPMDGREAHDGWTEGQNAALQAAYLVEEDPAQPGFWARVAGRVPGKSAAECFNRLYDAVPTPAPPPAAARRAAAAAAVPLRPPALTAASGRARRAPAETRKFARAARRQEFAGNLGARGLAGAGGESRMGPAGGITRAPALDRLVQVMRRQERTDKYIDVLLRKRGPPQRWGAGAAAGAPPPSGRAGSAGAGDGNAVAAARAGAAGAAREAAVLAAARGYAESESDEESERDLYFSDGSG